MKFTIQRSEKYTKNKITLTSEELRLKLKFGQDTDIEKDIIDFAHYISENVVTTKSLRGIVNELDLSVVLHFDNKKAVMKIYHDPFSVEKY